MPASALISRSRQDDVELPYRLLDVPGALAAARHDEAVAGPVAFHAALVVDHVDTALQQVDELVVRRRLDNVPVRFALPNTSIELTGLIGVVAQAPLLWVAGLQRVRGDLLGRLQA